MSPELELEEELLEDEDELLEEDDALLLDEEELPPAGPPLPPQLTKPTQAAKIAAPNRRLKRWGSIMIVTPKYCVVIM